MRPRRQQGQALPLAALLITVLIGFVGLVIDGGEAANEQQSVRGAADGAALAGIYAISKGSATTAATTFAQQVLVAVPLPIADLTMSYLDAGGSPTVVTANVVTVRAVVADSHRTFFLGALGTPTVVLTATADAKNQSSAVAAACAVCLMEPIAIGFGERNNGSMTISGGSLQVNSTNAAAINQSNGASLSAPSITVVGGVVKGTGTITPGPVTGSAIPDPLAAIPVPVVAGSAVAFTAPAGASALAPGVYSTITVNSGSTLTLNPGTFVVTSQLNVNGGTVIGTGGVTLFFGCAAYPTPCGVGASGGHLTQSAGVLDLSPPTLGTYAGLNVFADRNNVAGSTFNAVTSANTIIAGTWYSVLEAMTDGTIGDSASFGQLVIASWSQPNNSNFTVSRSATGSYGTGGGGALGLTR
jgi:Flp pilus assembly protein TadG